jgi:receptor protein-tyrosine kinase
MLSEPEGREAEQFRILRTSVDFANYWSHHRVIMFTSALEREGKSTTVANLALAYARAGRRVAVVDLDLRRPYLDRFFEVPYKPGFSDVALGHVDLDQALAMLALGHSSTNGSGANGATSGTPGVVAVLAAGSKPPDIGDFLEVADVAGVLAALRDRFDLVLVDAPPLLPVVDAFSLSAKVDALVVVTRLDLLHRPAVDELHSALDRCPTVKLGFIVTDAARGDDRGTGYGYGYGAARKSSAASVEVESEPVA